MAGIRDRVAIVTGASSGIGAATASRLADEGAHVLASGRDRERGEGLATGSERIRFFSGDLTEPGTPRRLVGEAVAAHGRLDVLVNNAALDHTGDLLEVGLDEVREIFEVNFFAAFAMLQEAARAMRERGGAIVNVTSRLASFGVETMGVYGASKGALLALTRSAALELAPHGIRVNAVAPGMTRTPLYDSWVAGQADADRVEREAAEVVPQKRIAEPAEVAAAIAFLASEDASHITGASLPVDGGFAAS